MNDSRSYDPLTVEQLGRNAARALMEYPAVALPRLVLAPVWLGLTEQILIDQYRPVWNAIRGFGNHDQGRTRNAQRRSQWDTLHPGRAWAALQQDLPGGRDDVLAAIRQHREDAT